MTGEFLHAHARRALRELRLYIVGEVDKRSFGGEFPPFNNSLGNFLACQRVGGCNHRESKNGSEEEKWTPQVAFST
jgi:hypothetical protein